MRSRSHTSRASRRGAVSMSTMALLAVAVGCTMLVTQRISDSRNRAPVNLAENAGVVAGTDTAAQSAPTIEQAVGALTVKDARGKRVPLVTKGEPAIIMVSSVTCSWCKRTLKDLGELSAGRPLPRLKLLTLEGAAEGAPMLAKEHITGAQLIGPAAGRDQVMLTFRYPGTPTFLAVDKNGRVVGTMPGYPMREVLKTWYAVMVGDADTP